MQYEIGACYRFLQDNFGLFFEEQKALEFCIDSMFFPKRNGLFILLGKFEKLCFSDEFDNINIIIILKLLYDKQIVYLPYKINSDFGQNQKNFIERIK